MSYTVKSIRNPVIKTCWNDYPVFISTTADHCNVHFNYDTNNEELDDGTKLLPVL